MTLCPSCPLRLFRRIALIYIFPLLLISCTQGEYLKEAPLANKGVLDLTRWNFAKDGPVNLSGEWEFYWEKLLDDKSLAGGNHQNSKTFIYVPKIWNGEKIKEEKISGDGYATYHLKVYMQTASLPMAFKIMSMGSAYRLYVNGREVTSDGTVGTNRQTMTPGWHPHVAGYTPEGDQMDIILQVSNFNHRKGGAFEAIKFGTEQDIQSIRDNNIALCLFVCGSIFIMGIYHLVVFFLRIKDRAPLYLGIFCLLISVYAGLSGERFLANFYPWANWEFMVMFTNLACFMILPFSLLFLRKLFPEEIKKRFLVVLLLTILLLCSVVLSTPARIFSHIIPVFHVVAMIAAIYAIYALSLALFRRREGAFILLAASCFFVASVINDILYDNQVIRTGQLIHLGMFMFIFIECILLSRRSSKAFTNVENLAEALTRKNNVLVNEIDMRMKTEVALTESEKKYRLLIENASEAIFILQDSKVKFHNKRAEVMSGYSKEELNEVNFLDLVPAEDREVSINRHEGRLDGKTLPFNGRFRVIAKSGEERWVSMNAVKVVWEGQPAVLCFAWDVTQEKNLEDDLKRAQKMEAIGTLAGGVAHDLNNVLSGIVSYPDLLLTQIPEDSPLRDSIETIRHTGEKAAAIVLDLLTLARRGVPNHVVTNLNDILADYLRSPEHAKMKSFHYNVKFITDFKRDLLNIKGSTFHLSKSIMNLVSNAAESMPDGGILSISTENRNVDMTSSSYTQVPPGDYVTVTISDTGVGISSEDRDRIFDPFYTKKIMGRSGTGLGMTVVWGTVKDHNGYIELESSVGNGTVFTLYFPATREEKTIRTDKLASDKYRGNGELVLVVDDVTEQRDIASKILKHLGYSVSTVSNGEEAIEYLRHHKVDIVLLDMIMDPGIDGLETYKQIIKNHPGQRAIITSGYSETGRVQEAMSMGVGTYIKKPYTLELLGTTVKKELNL